MILSKNISIVAALLAINLTSQTVRSHGYLKTPRSRNYYARVEGKWSGGTESDPAVETCPHCLNIGGTEARCGFVGDHNYDLPPNSVGGIMPAVIQGCYKPGSDIVFESVLTAHHMGHFAFKACPISHGEVPTQACFDANPLTFLSDELYGANVDQFYPERAYIPRTDFEGGLVRDAGGDYIMRHKYRLPAGLSGDLVLIQWHYVTGNSCKDVGYDTYDWPNGFYPGNLPICAQPLPEDGRGVPEQFWNCAELKISSECDGPDPEPTSTTTSSTTVTGATVINSSTTSTSSTTTKTTQSGGTCAAETGACGPNNPCSHGLCCSQWGYCGTTEAYCGVCCQSNCWDNPTPSTTQPTKKATAPPTTNPVSTHATTTSSTKVTSTATTTTTTSKKPSGALVIDTSNRCGFTELDARENCKSVCTTDSDCDAGEFCWNPHENYCGSIPKRTYNNPVQSNVVSRCGTSELMARTFCGEPCSWQCSIPGESCIAVHSNYCGSDYVEEVTPNTTQGTSTSTTQATSSSSFTTTETTTMTSTGENNPTKPPTTKPTIQPTTLFPTPTPITRPPTSSTAAAVEAVLEASKDGIDNKILLYQTPTMQWEPSSVYRYSDLLSALRVMYNDGVAGKYFYMGDDSPYGYKYGLVNIAAFLAQSMKETIQYNACDENSWDLVNGVYPVSNACGQLGQSYQDYKCSADEAHMECPVNPNLKIKATTNAKWYGAPAPLYCGPKTDYPFTGYWDYSAECNKPWANPPEYCEEYNGQKAGAFNNNSPVPNSSGRTDVEGCCFWGRGVIQTTGVCNFGKLNYYLGARAAEEGRVSRYPDINFCERPDAICASAEHKELKWIAGMFFWVESLQSYNVGGWDYITELKKFVDNGMSGNSFVDAVSGIVNRGCHNPPCATGDVDGKADRSSNFYKVLREFGII